VYLSSAYGWREPPTEGASTFHGGVDLAGAEGTPIYATRSGYVYRNGYTEYNGYYVGIDHGDGFASAYLHLTHYIVSVGEYVSQGQVIGYMGSTGVSTGPHLHFTVYYNGDTVNPAEYIDFY
jgi:murein DD-endopeptidase MepM/ murein hydrolase activator NlpD